MIDTDKYEGHAEGEWVIEMNDTGDECAIHAQDYGTIAQTFYRDHDKLFMATSRLIAGAPLLLAEVKRLQKENDNLEGQIAKESIEEVKHLRKQLDSLREFCHKEDYDIYDWEVKNIEVIE